MQLKSNNKMSCCLFINLSRFYVKLSFKNQQEIFLKLKSKALKLLYILNY